MLNKLRCHNHYWLSANQIAWSALLMQIHILNDKQCRSRSVGFFRSQLIWTYTVCKDIQAQPDQCYYGSFWISLNTCDKQIRPVYNHSSIKIVTFSTLCTKLLVPKTRMTLMPITFDKMLIWGQQCYIMYVPIERILKEIPWSKQHVNLPWLQTGICICMVPASVAQLDVCSTSDQKVVGLTPIGLQHSLVGIDQEIFSMVILSLPLIQEGHLSISGKRMCTILVNCFED